MEYLLRWSAGRGSYLFAMSYLYAMFHLLLLLLFVLGGFCGGLWALFGLVGSKLNERSRSKPREWSVPHPGVCLILRTWQASSLSLTLRNPQSGHSPWIGDSSPANCPQPSQGLSNWKEVQNVSFQSQLLPYSWGLSSSPEELAMGHLLPIRRGT